MSKIIDFVKAHPYGVAIGVAGVGISYIYLKNSGASSASTTVDGSTDPNYATDVAAATALQQQQVAANVASLQSNNQAQTQITVAGYQSADTLAGIQAQQAVQMNADTLSAQTTQAVSTLQAQVAENQTAAAVQESQIQAAAYTQIALAPYNSQDYIANLQFQANEDANANAAAQLLNLQGELTAIQNFANAHPTSPFGEELPGVIANYQNTATQTVTH